MRPRLRSITGILCACRYAFAVETAFNASFFTSGLTAPVPCPGDAANGIGASMHAVSPNSGINQVDHEWRPIALIPWRETATGSDFLIAAGFSAGMDPHRMWSGSIGVSPNIGTEWNCIQPHLSGPALAHGSIVRELAGYGSYVSGTCSLSCVFGGQPVNVTSGEVMPATNSVLCSHDAGRTWKEHAPIPMPGPILSPAAVAHEGRFLLLASNQKETTFFKSILDVTSCKISAWQADAHWQTTGIGIRTQMSLASVPDPAYPDSHEMIVMAGGQVFVSGTHMRVWDVWVWRSKGTGTINPARVSHTLPLPSDWSAHNLTRDDPWQFYQLLPAVLGGNALGVPGLAPSDLLWQAGGSMWISKNVGHNWQPVGLMHWAPKAFRTEALGMFSRAVVAHDHQGVPYITAVFRHLMGHNKHKGWGDDDGDWTLPTHLGNASGTVPAFVRLSMLQCDVSCSQGSEASPGQRHETRSTGCVSSPLDATCVACTQCALGMKELIPCGGRDGLQPVDTICESEAVHLLPPPQYRGSNLWRLSELSITSAAAATLLLSLLRLVCQQQLLQDGKQDFRAPTVASMCAAARSALSTARARPYKTLIIVLSPVVTVAACTCHLVLSIALFHTALTAEGTLVSVTPAEAGPFSDLVASSSNDPLLVGAVLMACASVQLVGWAIRFLDAMCTLMMGRGVTDTFEAVLKSGSWRTLADSRTPYPLHCAVPTALSITVPKAYWIAVLSDRSKDMTPESLVADFWATVSLTLEISPFCVLVAHASSGNKIASSTLPLVYTAAALSAVSIGLTQIVRNSVLRRSTQYDACWKGISLLVLGMRDSNEDKDNIKGAVAAGAEHEQPSATHDDHDTVTLSQDARRSHDDATADTYIPLEECVVGRSTGAWPPILYEHYETDRPRHGQGSVTRACEVTHVRDGAPSGQVTEAASAGHSQHVTSPLLPAAVLSAPASVQQATTATVFSSATAGPPAGTHGPSPVPRLSFMAHRASSSSSSSSSSAPLVVVRAVRRGDSSHDSGVRANAEPGQQPGATGHAADVSSPHGHPRSRSGDPADDASASPNTLNGRHSSVSFNARRVSACSVSASLRHELEALDGLDADPDVERLSSSLQSDPDGLMTEALLRGRLTH